MQRIMTIKEDSSRYQNNQNLDYSCCAGLSQNLRGQPRDVVLGHTQSKVKELIDKSFLHCCSDLFRCIFSIIYKFQRLSDINVNLSTHPTYGELAERSTREWMLSAASL